MKQKEVKINGLKFNHQFGIVEVCEIEYNPEIKMYVMKGKVGQGKTTTTKALQLGTSGIEALKSDKDLYGKIDLEVKMTDGEMPVFVGCKTDKTGIKYVLYTKDENGKKINNPVIDGEKCTPAQYLKALQTELTWRMDELISENPSIQKKMLLKLYQSGLKKSGVIFDKNHPEYKSSILGQIDQAINDRDMSDMIRKQKGGIADDLKAEGFDPDRPETCPNLIDLYLISQEIEDLKKEKIQKETNNESVKDKELAEIKAEAQAIVNDCLNYNSEIVDEYNKKQNAFSDFEKKESEISGLISQISDILILLGLDDSYLDKIRNDIKYPQKVTKPQKPEIVLFDKEKKIDYSNYNELPEQAKKLLDKNTELRNRYIEKYNQPNEFDSTEIDSKIEQLKEKKQKAEENNKIVEAIESFYKFRSADGKVKKLKTDYIKMLSNIDTGVDGLKILPDGDNIVLMYDGSYDPKYFSNEKKELRKVSSYSGTQKPIICMLIQNHLLNKKTKAMRYMYIDNIPIDQASKNIIEKISANLNLHIFLNITGDFDKESLQNGEFLIEGGQVFFND